MHGHMQGSARGDGMAPSQEARTQKWGVVCSESGGYAGTRPSHYSRTVGAEWCPHFMPHQNGGFDTGVPRV